MKKLLLILPVLVACKASKPSCEAYGSIPRADTVYLEQIHDHFETDSTYKCIYFPEETFIITYHDTSTQVQTK
jgi:hypothetical protein